VKIPSPPTPSPIQTLPCFSPPWYISLRSLASENSFTTSSVSNELWPWLHDGAWCWAISPERLERLKLCIYVCVTAVLRWTLACRPKGLRGYVLSFRLSALLLRQAWINTSPGQHSTLQPTTASALLEARQGGQARKGSVSGRAQRQCKTR
jgi:hypothetical protein